MHPERPRVNIIADDLTGALDSAVAFADRGLSVAVAVRPDALDEALADGAEVVAVNSDTRDASPETAAAAVAGLAAQMASRGGLFLKKIDSRLKGHVAAETAAMLRAIGCARVVVSPAIPLLGRLVRDGKVIGAGIDVPLDIRASLPEDVEAIIADVGAPDDLVPSAHAVLTDPAGALAVGAAGLANAIAARFAARDMPAIPALDGALLMLIGSRDPVTLGQIDHLRRVRPDIRYAVAPDGRLASQPAPNGPMLVHGVGFPGAPGVRAIARNLAMSAAPMIKTGVGAILACGGDTAVALMTALDTGVLRPCGQPMPGVPVCAFEHQGRTILLATKSGGFGAPGTLALLADRFTMPD